MFSELRGTYGGSLHGEGLLWTPQLVQRTREDKGNVEKWKGREEADGLTVLKERITCSFRSDEMISPLQSQQVLGHPGRKEFVL